MPCLNKFACFWACGLRIAII